MSPDRGSESVGDGVEATQIAVSQQHGARDAVNSVPPHLSHDPTNNAKRTDPFQFGNRFLNNEDDVFEFNAWDHVEPDEEHLAYAQEQFAKQRAAPVSTFDYGRFNDAPEKWWDLFYKQKSSTFFKDRKWLVQEFPVLGEVTARNAGQKVVLEVGAGAGNTAFPVMRINQNPELEVVAADFSKRAVETMRNAEDYTAQDRIGKMRAEVWDVAGEDLPEGLSEGSVDVVVMIFIFSALNPKQWRRALWNVWRLLKRDGTVLFRDYGRGDLAQVRFKAGRYMEENFYVRGDGTRVYFFDKDELDSLWTGEYWNKSCDQDRVESELVTTPMNNNEGNDEAQKSNGQDGDDGELPRSRFEVLNLDADRRLIVNRQRKIKMYRCWMQGRFKKVTD